VPCKLSVPGFVLLKGRLLKNGSPVNKEYLLAGAGMRVAEISPVSPEPPDFDKFWQTQLTALRARKATVSETEIAVPKAFASKVKAYDVRIEDGILNATGILIVPEGAKPKSIAAIATFAGASWIGTRPNYSLAAGANALVFCMNLHDTKNQPSIEETALLKNAISGYQFRNPDDPEKYPMKNIFLRIVRTMDYLQARTEWDGARLIASGGSLGGAQAIVAAALVPQVTLCNSQAPALCDHGAAEAGQTPGWPDLFASINDPDALAKAKKNMQYFDMVNFARRVKCQTMMCTGFIDTTCPPVTNYAVFNVLGSANKSMANMTLAGHGNSRKPGELNVFAYGYDYIRKICQK